MEMSKRNYVFVTIRSVYKRHGFQQIETPSMETLQTLMGKYGEEGDKLLFKILNSGDYLSKIAPEEMAQANSLQLAPKLCEKGLRYDLTVPLARYVVMHREELQLPFKRFQIQPVWRADRPQRGRYREFYQCDADIVGSTSLLNELELLQIFDEVFAGLGIRVKILLNNRKVLAGIAEAIGQSDKLTAITIALDKLDKIGPDGVKAELERAELGQEAIDRLLTAVAAEGTNKERLQQMAQFLQQSAVGCEGIAEIEELLQLLQNIETSAEISLDFTLARGLNYYTGAIFEVKALDAAIGSIAAGGRYDNLTGIFGLPGISGVGISFGADRICDVLETLQLYPSDAQQSTQVLFVNFGQEFVSHTLAPAETLRRQGVAVEIYPDPAKMKKQMAYANAKNIPFVALMGSDEVEQGIVAIRNMTTGEQQKYPIDKINLLFNQK